MLTHTLLQLFERDLRKLQDEIGKYNDEKNLWKVPAGISNSAGNLCLHLIGNLKHFTGAVLNHSGYIRKRDEEFSTKNVARKELLQGLVETINVVKDTLENFPDADLGETYPVKVFEDEMTIEFFLLHLLAHLNYHLGQVNYHRRLVEGGGMTTSFS